MKTVRSSFAGMLLILLSLLNFPSSYSQSLIMNEVSNGPSGNKEYVEFVVIDTAVVYDCGDTDPPCIDIRGWIFDDNSGYHGTGGIAAGAIRFSSDPLWSCVPLGTIILIYNDADVNPDIPSIDVSTTDGNCRIVAPIGSLTLFETNLTTPGAVACSYPSTGWTAGGLWSSTLMANTGDCARIVDLAGCEVFSVCWASCSTSTLIYFSSGGSGTDNVWYFNDGDPNDQTNWNEGCADASSCGVNDQTPGSANNASNAAYIAQFNNGCNPITPIASGISGFTNATCSCDGTATVNASGSIAGYTYTWFDSAMNPIGQTTPTATGLCAGTYYVISTSSIGCADTASVTITSTGVVPSVNVSPSSVSICAGDSIVLTGSGAATYNWTPGSGLLSTTGTSVVAFPSTTTTYTVIGTDASGCTNTATVLITVNTLPIISIPTVPDVCEDLPSFLLSASPAGGIWSGTGVTTGGMFNATGLGGTSSTLTYVYTDGLGCTNSSTTTINVDALPTISLTTPATLCTSQAPVTLAASPSGGSWSGTGVSSGGVFDPASSGAGTFTITYTVTNGACTADNAVNVTVTNGPIVDILPISALCENASSLTLSASPVGGTWSGSGVSSTGIVDPAVLGSGLFTAIYNYTSGTCTGSDTLAITIDNVPVVSINPVATLCESSDTITITATLAGGIWTGPGITSSILGTFSPALAGVGSHNIIYTISSGACTTSVSTFINVVESPDITIIPTGPLAFCAGGNVQLNAIYSGSETIFWSNGSTGSTITVSETGNYYAYVTSSCGIDTSNLLTVNVYNVNPSFNLDPSTGQAPLTVNIQNTTSDVLSYTWIINDSIFITNTDTSWNYTEPGEYDITLIVTNINGCTDTISQTVLVYGEFNIIVPNIITPNGDGVNDVFSVLIAGINELEYSIYDRWGILLQKGNLTELADGKTPLWDAKSNGDLVSDGSYAYIIKAVGYLSEEKIITGFVTVVTKK